jgi:hypothetical protein
MKGNLIPKYMTDCSTVVGDLISLNVSIWLKFYNTLYQTNFFTEFVIIVGCYSWCDWFTILDLPDYRFCPLLQYIMVFNMKWRFYNIWLILWQILFVLGGAFVGMLLAVLGYGYNTLNSEHSNKFLLDFYNLDFKGFLQPVDTRVLINVSHVAYKCRSCHNSLQVM